MGSPNQASQLSRTIALVDGSAGGHHVMYLRKFGRALLELGHTVLAVIRDPAPVRARLLEACPQHMGRMHFFPFDDQQDIVSPVWRLRKLYVPLEKWRRVARALRAASSETGLAPDLVFFCWLDAYLLEGSRLVSALLPLAFPYRWSGVFFHPWHLRTPSGAGREVLPATEHMLRSARCASVAVLDEGIAATLEAKIRRRVVTFPDDTDDTVPASEDPMVARIRAMANGRKIVGLIGAMEKRKGVLRLMDVAERSQDREWFFVFVGELSEGVRKTYSEEELQRIDETARRGLPNALFHFGFLPGERQFNAVIAACDALFAAYGPFYHSSGILAKAACFERPVIVSRGYCMHERVQRFSIGVSVDPDDIRDIISALECVLDEHAFRARVGGAPDYAGYRAVHSRENLTSAFASVVEQGAK